PRISDPDRADVGFKGFAVAAQLFGGDACWQYCYFLVCEAEYSYVRIPENVRQYYGHDSFSLTWKDDDLAFLVLDNSNPDSTWRFAYSPLPEHAVRLFADGDFICLHSLRYELSEEPDRSWGPLLARSIPYSAKVKIIEFLFNDFQLLFFCFLCLCWSFRSFFGLDFFLFLLRDFFRLLFDLRLDRPNLFRFFQNGIVFLFWPSSCMRVFFNCSSLTCPRSLPDWASCMSCISSSSANSGFTIRMLVRRCLASGVRILRIIVCFCRSTCCCACVRR